MTASVRRILDFAEQGAISPVWKQRKTEIRSERNCVLEFLSGDNPPAVYGFNTLFGQLDRKGVVEARQIDLLQAHLLGPQRGMEPSAFRILVASKIEQLSSTFSGISPAMYASLLDSLDELPDSTVYGAWDSSYGSGDVVPASWMARTLMERGLLADPEAGDVMCLINGSFYGAGYALQAARSLSEKLGDGFDFAISNFSYPSLKYADASDWNPDLLAGADHSVFSKVPQLPVSLRDISPLLLSFRENWNRLIRAISQRLERPSSNPIFEPDPAAGGIRAVSNSSFLDFGLSDALRDISYDLARISFFLQRVMAHVVRVAEEHCNPAEVPQFVQFPKVALAIAVRIESTLSLDFSAYLSESDGVEDQADHSVLRVKAIESCLDDLVHLMEMAEESMRRLRRYVDNADVLGDPWPVSRSLIDSEFLSFG